MERIEIPPEEAVSGLPARLPTYGNQIPEEKNIARARMKIIIKFLAPVSAFMNELYKEVPSKSFGMNKVFDVNCREAVIGEYRKFKIDYSKLMLSRGKLAIPPGLSVSSPEHEFLVFRWTDDSGIGNAQAYDQAFLVVYNKESKCWAVQLNAAIRKDRRYIMNVDEFSGKLVHVYIGFVSLDLARTSDSVYMGEVRVL